MPATQRCFEARRRKADVELILETTGTNGAVFAFRGYLDNTMPSLVNVRSTPRPRGISSSAAGAKPSLAMAVTAHGIGPQLLQLWRKAIQVAIHVHHEIEV